MIDLKESNPMTSIDGTRENQNSSLIVLSTLFFMWGLITVTNFMLIDELMNVFMLSITEANIINLAFFGTYFVVSIPAGKLINGIGYKNGIIAGIVIAGIGCMLFYPAADARSYSMVLLAMFVLATGITILQVGANPYVVLIGRKHTGASRLTLVQAFNSLGTMLAPLLAAGLFMKIANYSPAELERMSPEGIRDAAATYVQLPYLTLGAIMFLLALLVGFSKLPKIITHEMEPLVKEPASGPRKYVLQFPHLVLGALAIFAYVGAEVTLGRYLVLQHIQATIQGSITGNQGLAPMIERLIVFYWGGAMIGRFFGAYILTVLSPRKLIGLCSLIAAVLVAAYAFSGPSTDTSLWPIVAVGLFNSILFPCIFSMGIDGLGKFSEEGSSILIMSIVGGAITPFIFFELMDVSVIAAFGLIILSYLYITFYGFKGSVYKKK
ncbi:MAG: sugar MFS transporter [Cytophagaceae bacterium]